MEKKLYQKIVDEAVETGINFINLHNFGEPLLDKDLVWRIKYAKKRSNKQSTCERIPKQALNPNAKSPK